MAAVGLVAVVMLTVVVVGTARVHSPAQCIADVKEQKRIETELRIQELRQRRAEDAARRAEEEATQDPAPETAPKPSNNSGFGNAFNPGTLQNEGEEGSDAEPEKPSNNSGFGNVFDPGALQSE